MVEAGYDWIELDNGERRRPGTKEIDGEIPLPKGLRFESSILVSAGASELGSLPFAFQGRTYQRAVATHWKTKVEGLERLGYANLARSVANVINKSQVNKEDLITRRVDPRIGFQISRIDIPCNSYYIDTTMN